jgi:hypothetical protein
MTQLDSGGVGRFTHQILSFGAYTIAVDCGGGLMTSGMADVDSSDPGCP